MSTFRPSNQKIPVIINQMRVFCFLLLATLATTTIIGSSNSLAPTSLTLTELQPLRQIDDIFSRLPSLQELDQLVLTADSVAILKTIQQVASNNELDCKFKISYLLELQGRMKSAVYKKSLIAKQLYIIIKSAENQADRLQLQNQKLSTQKRLLFLEQKKFELGIHVSETEALYTKYNDLKNKMENQQIQLQIVKQNRILVEKEVEIQNEQLTYLNVELSGVQARIKFFGSTEKFLQIQKTALLTEIQQTQNLIENLQQQIYETRKKQATIQGNIESLRKQLDSIQTKFVQLQVVLSQQRDEIAAGEKKQDEINARIAINDEKIVQERKKILWAEFYNLQQMVDSLKSQLPGIQKQIDLQYYLCFLGPNAVKSVAQNTTYVFILKGPQMEQYISKAYQLPFNISQGQFTLRNLDILSQNWAQNYGAAFNTAQTLKDDPFSEITIFSDFFCLNPSNAVSGLAQIERIDQRTILIKDISSTRYTLILGSCTRLQCSNCVDWAVPVGSKIIWRGVVHPQNRSYIQLHAGTIF